MYRRLRIFLEKSASFLSENKPQEVVCGLFSYLVVSFLPILMIFVLFASEKENEL